MTGGYLERKAAQVRQRAAALGAEPALEFPPNVTRSALAATTSFAAALRAGPTVALVAEFKRRSPSGGDLLSDETPGDIAQLYADSGARAMSVLTDAEDFGGSLDDLTAATRSVELPVLRKDFLLREADLVEARLAGAAAALLIVRMLTDAELHRLLRSAAENGIEGLVEVHDEGELDRALAAGATLIGVNNRDLDRLVTDLQVTERLAPRVTGDVTVVSESGIRSEDDVARVRDAGAHAVLVGETILRTARDRRRGVVRALSGVPR